VKRVGVRPRKRPEIPLVFMIWVSIEMMENFVCGADADADAEAEAEAEAVIEPSICIWVFTKSSGAHTIAPTAPPMQPPTKDTEREGAEETTAAGKSLMVGCRCRFGATIGDEVGEWSRDKCESEMYGISNN